MRPWPLLALLLLAFSRPASVPWPGGRSPDRAAVAHDLAQATHRWEQDRYLEFKSATEDETEVAVVEVDQRELEDGTFDLATVHHYGRRFFQLPWRRAMGWGGQRAEPRMQVVHRGAEAGQDAQSCEGCHSLGGLDGAGTFNQSALLYGDGDSASSALRRNPPPLLGLGLVQALAAEISAHLQAQRDLAIALARSSGAPVEQELSSHGISFGRLRALPDGGVDLSGLEGISPDLVLRPFGWKGERATLRSMVEEAARLHLGVISHPLARRQRQEGDLSWEDPDRDGRRRELEEGSLSAASLYFALLEAPVQLPPSDPGLLQRWARGRTLFGELGCASCHRPQLRLQSRRWVEPTDQGPSAFSFLLLQEGDLPRGSDEVALYSDLKRHDMGPGLAEAADPSGLGASVFLTRPLWGLAESAPYLHDGRALSIPEAVLAHGGEAEASRAAFAALSPARQADLHIFLLSLSRNPGLHMAR
jgi:Di-haem oxidoreductase, putative peroxidase